jgi:hypothetical protein
MVDEEWRELLWGQLGGAIDMLENAILACPDEVWRAGEPARALWYLTYHTLFFLDLYTFGTLDGFAPPAPFTLDELDRLASTLSGPTAVPNWSSISGRVAISARQQSRR